MSEQWTVPRRSGGPLPSSHACVQIGVSRANRPIGFWRRCGGYKPVTQDQVDRMTPEPPPTTQGPTCETCLRLKNRDVQEPVFVLDDSGQVVEDDASTAPTEMTDVP